ncbi:MAG: TonB-dependent receptor [Saprospiraceae bacterium]|nr:TonB-dependent receptor [Saprospiraceae bacterium]
MKKQQLSFLLSIISVFCSINIFAQGTIKGIIKDSLENEPLLGAEVRINDLQGNFVTGGATDFIEGVFNISINAGTYEMVCSYMGYASNSQSVTIKNGETTEITINMAEEVNVLKVVTKTASRFETPVGKSSISLDVVKPSLVENTNATKVDEVITKVPGVTVVDGQANIRGGSGFSYGAGSRVLLLVDDLPLLTGDAGQPNWRDIPVENISQIEVVKGAASALYGSSALNGIINIRTAYAKNKPVTKIALFQSSFLNPKRAETAWWNRNKVIVNDADESAPLASDTIAPAFLSGRNGYRKPMELGLQFAHRRKIGKFDLTLGGNYFYQDSYRMGAYERKYRFNSNMRYRFNTKVNIGANFNINYGQSASFFIWGNEMPLVSPFFTTGDTVVNDIYVPIANSITESVIFRVNIDPYFTAYDKKNGKHRLQTRYYHVNNQNGQNQSNLSNLGYAEYQYQRKFKINSSFFGDFKFVTGAVGMYTYAESQLFGNATYNIVNAAFYIQGEQGLIKEKNSDNTKLSITFGARVEYNRIESPDSVQVDPTQAGLILNPEPLSQEAKPVFRLGLNYELTPFTFIRASWGQGYRYPTIAERYITTQIGTGFTSLAIRANPELQSETGWSTEIGIKQGFKIGNWKGFADLSGFWTEYQNMMEFTFGGGDPQQTGLGNIFFQSVNIDDTRIRGFEFSLMGTGNIGKVDFNVLAGYTFIAPEFQNWDDSVKGPVIQALSSANYNILKYRNVHTFKFDIECFLIKKALSIGLSLNYNSRMDNIDKAFENIIADPSWDSDVFGLGYYRQNFNSGEFLNLSARIGYRHSFKNSSKNEIAAVKISVVGKNLLNQEYMIRPALVDAPTNITVRLDVEF